MDCVRGRVDSLVLAAIWCAEFSVLLRPGKFVHGRGIVARKFTSVFLAGVRLAVISDFVCGGPCGHDSKWKAFNRRHGVYVRSACAAADSIAEPVSCGHATAAALGHLAFGLRFAGLEVPDADHVDCGSDQLFVASTS